MLFIVCGCFSACRSHSEGQRKSEDMISNDEYAIHSLCLLHRLEAGSHPQTLLIRVEADNSWVGHCLPESVKDSKISLEAKEIEGLISDFKAQNLIQGKIIRPLDLPIKQKFITDAEYTFAVTDRNWEEFYKKFPDAREFESFSRVGFNSDRTKALTHTRSVGKGTGDLGCYMFFSKENGKWKIIGEVSCGVS